MRFLLAIGLLLTAAATHAGDAWRVAVVGNAPPMSYVAPDGQLTGFNVELGRALCETLEQPCAFKLYPLAEVVDALAKGQADFAVVSLLVTPERSAKVLFTKPLYRSLSVWLSAQPFPGQSMPPMTVAVVQGSAQHIYAQTRGWPLKVLATHTEVFDAVSSGQARAALLPMNTGMNVVRDRRFGATGWSYLLVSEPGLSGDVAISVSPGQPQLVGRLNEALDKLRRSGRFDRINTEFLPFRLQ